MKDTVARIIARLGVVAGGSAEPAAFLLAAADDLRESLGCSAVAVLQGSRGDWIRLATKGPCPAVAESLAAEVLDRETTITRGGLMAVPMDCSTGTVLVTSGLVTGGAVAPQVAREEAEAIAAALSTAWTLVAARAAERRRAERLQAILDIAAQWNQTLEMDVLLHQMAETSTRLLHAERASIFLWDRDTKTLVGRPALGVAGGELRIPDDRGIVGQVIRTGEPRRVAARDLAASQINRQVDQQLHFVTHNLLCVPLRGRQGQLFGAFELINRLEGDFSTDDQTALSELAGHAAIAIENTQSYEHLLRVRNLLADEAVQGAQMIGNCPAVDELRKTIRRLAEIDLAVMVLGENGTGKEVVSRSIHYLSPRRREPFVAVNCAALTETLLESELFGHEKGAFTDAHATRLGKFELASGGTLFLDEIGDMSLAGQAKLLRVLEEKVVVRVGGSTPIHTNARIIAATNQDLSELVRLRKFREDLFFRLHVVTLHVPPLRERGDDVLLLAEHFLREFCQQARRPAPRLSAAARKRLFGHSWPGNIRELRNMMERIAYLSTTVVVEAEDLVFVHSRDEPDAAAISYNQPLAEATQEFQIDYIQHHLNRARGNMSDAAVRLGLHRSNLYRKMKQLGMEPGQ